ncbi:MAG: MarR family transcriptional regulator [Cyanobacteria bacterium]|nr:MarR family transcriptional regulator [Cyanobacteriota bacterium]
MLNKHSITKWISILYRYGQSHISRQLSSYNIGSGQYIFLIALYKRDGISQEELSDHLKIEKATTAKAIKRLEKEGYIKKDINSSDKRAYKIFLTQKALDVKPVIFKLLKDWSDFLMTGFTEDEKKVIFNLMERMANNAFSSFNKQDNAKDN